MCASLVVIHAVKLIVDTDKVICAKLVNDQSISERRRTELMAKDRAAVVPCVRISEQIQFMHKFSQIEKDEEILCNERTHSVAVFSGKVCVLRLNLSVV